VSILTVSLYVVFKFTFFTDFILTFCILVQILSKNCKLVQFFTFSNQSIFSFPICRTVLFHSFWQFGHFLSFYSLVPSFIKLQVSPQDATQANSGHMSAYIRLRSVQIRGGSTEILPSHKQFTNFSLMLVRSKCNKIKEAEEHEEES